VRRAEEGDAIRASTGAQLHSAARVPLEYSGARARIHAGHELIGCARNPSPQGSHEGQDKIRTVRARKTQDFCVAIRFPGADCETIEVGVDLGTRLPRMVTWRGMTVNMKSNVKGLIFALGRHSILLVWLLNFVYYLRWTLWFLPKRYRKWNFRYEDASGALGVSPTMQNSNEQSTNFFARLILQSKYAYAIELGSYSADRSIALARLFPAVKIYALDITRDFLEERVFQGVTLAPSSLSKIGSIAKSETGRGLLFANHVYTCVPYEDVLAIFKTALDLGLDLAIAEPNSVGEGTMPHPLRRTRNTWYHPYLPTLRSLGYRMPDNNGNQVSDSFVEFGDRRTYIFAENPQATK
jgi:hypothetical protein